MTTLIKSNERGQADHGWLKSHHTFSFANYYNPARMGFGVLRVINEDRIAGGTGFGTHPHRDMEIISYAVDGALEHKDSMGTETVIRPGEIQRMSAGTGVRHSEYNHSPDKEAHFLQIWILPEKEGLAPSYAQKSFASDFAKSDLTLVASKSGRNGSVTLNQDVNLYACKAQQAGEKVFKTSLQRKTWVQVIKGKVQVGSADLDSGDAAGIEDVESVNLKWTSGAEFLFFDLP